ncbi:MAG: HXXEE domain-containing protein [Pseudomonadota bacterium]
MTSETTLNSRLAALSAVFLFATLWIPFGHLDFMVEHWMKVGTFAALFMLIVFFACHVHAPGMSNASFMSIVFLVAYIAHQFEEHWIDLLGNRYAFFGYVNALIRRALGTVDPSVLPLTKASIYVINTSLVWLVGVIAIVRAKSSLFPLLAIASITLINGVTHVVAAVVTLSYNPGLVTSLILFLPLSVLFYTRVLRNRAAARNLVLWSLAWAIVAHVLMVVGLVAANVFRVVPELAYFCVLVAWSLLPLFMFPSHSAE